MEVNFMTIITKDSVLRAAENARLHLSDEEIAKYEIKLREMVTYIGKMEEVDTEGVQPTTHGNAITNIMRKDKPAEWAEREAALTNAPETEEGHFKVPAIME